LSGRRRRALRDEQLKKDIVRVYEENYSVYGAEKVWWALNREGIVVGRCRGDREKLGEAAFTAGRSLS
jgi:putative transposase